MNLEEFHKQKNHPMPLKTFEKDEKSVFYLVTALFIVFLLFRIISNIFHLADSYEYLEVAQGIYDASFFNSDTPYELRTKRPIIYPLLLALFIKFPVLVTLIFQTLISIFTTYLLFKIIKHFGVRIEKKHLWFFVFTPSIYIYTQLVMAEWLVLFFVTALFWLLLQKWSVKNFALIQIITVLLAFTKPVFYPLIYLNFIFFLILFIKKKVFSFWLFVPILVLQSYMMMNKAATGYYHFSSMQNINLINYNLYYFKSKTTSEDTATKWLDSVYHQEYNTKSFREKNNYLEGIAKKEIQQHFFKYALYHFYTSVRGVFDPGRFDLMTFFKKENGKEGLLHVLNTQNSILGLLKNKLAFVYILLIPIFFINLAKWFYAIKFLISNTLAFRMYYIIVLLICYILISGPVNCSRYMMPFQGMIIAFAILGISKNIYRRQKI